MTTEEAYILVSRIKDRQHTEAELQALLEYLQTAPRAEAESWMNVYYEATRDAEQHSAAAAAFADRFTQQQPLEPAPLRVSYRRRWAVAAAAAVLALMAGAYIWQQRSAPAKTPPVLAAAQPVLPGRQGAVLTLGDGSQVVLDSMANGLVATQSNAKVMLQNGQLQYNNAGNAGMVVYNTMRTPKGRQFRLQLPDGTEVWLNAGSSIRYPTAFTGNNREVEITGEAYFEVAQQAQKPFHVKAAGRADIEVLGTHFNINAYNNEATLNATLLQGAIRVTHGSSQVVLQPGQQARVADNVKIVQHADMDQVMAWKNGRFNFEDVPLEEAMRQLERWYDIDVVYEKGIPDIVFVGKISKQTPLADLLTILEKTGVHFKLEGKKLVVQP